MRKDKNIKISKENEIYLLINDYLEKQGISKRKAVSRLKHWNHIDKVYKILDYRINNESREENKDSLLSLGLSINRERYLAAFLCACGNNPVKMDRYAIQQRFNDAAVTENESKIIAEYIACNSDFDARLIKYLTGDALDIASTGILQYLDILDPSTKHLKVLSLNTKYLKQVQNLIRDQIISSPSQYKNRIRYLLLADVENLELLETTYTISVIHFYLQQTGTEYIGNDYSKVRISLKLIHHIPLDDAETVQLKTHILNKIDSINEESEEDNTLLKLLQDYSVLDKDFSENSLMILYQKTKTYSVKILNMLSEMHSVYAYRVLISILVKTGNNEEQCRVLSKLLHSFPDKVNSIKDYITIIDNPVLTRMLDKYLRNETPISEPGFELAQEMEFQLIPQNIEINELLLNIARKIKADTFYASVGFAFSSGLKLLEPLFKYISDKKGTIEMIIGSLQDYNKGHICKRMDKSTADLLNTIISARALKLFTYERAFYHGKFYYISNTQVAYVVIGSTNISKTAFFDNFELDTLLRVDLTTQNNNPCLEWYDQLRKHCKHLEQLDVTLFPELNWDSELGAFSEHFIHRISKDKMQQRIDNVDNVDTRNRLNMWMKHKPDSFFDVYNISALDQYIAFHFKSHSLAVFECLEPGNAYYVFRCEDFDELISEISDMSKTEMSNISAYIKKGNHIQDQTQLQQNIDWLFRSNSIFTE